MKPIPRKSRSILAGLLYLLALTGIATPMVSAEDVAKTVLPRVESLAIATSAPNNPRVPFLARIPTKFDPANTRIMVLFGGRNWEAERTLAAYRFDDLADRHQLILLAPGFKDDDYWQPEAWSGAALEQAILTLRERHSLPDRPVFYYGYSAGGQCANLFYAWKPERVTAWAVHACGVWFDPDKFIERKAPALATCGDGDDPRLILSRQFAYRYREAGGEIVWRDYATGHELTPAALELARAFFASILETDPSIPPLLVGDDDTGQLHPAATRSAERIPVELRNVFRTQALADVWQRQSRRE